MSVLTLGMAAAERGLLPDPVMRMAIRRLCRDRLSGLQRNAVVDQTNHGADTAIDRQLRTGPIAVAVDQANEQHYELPAEFFAAVLGPRLKYSCCYFEHDQMTLAEAEDAALMETCRRAGLEDGQDVLDLGCGWGSLSLWAAERFPASRITAVSNSLSQRHFIEAQARLRGLGNFQVLTADINCFSPGNAGFDRVVSVEMFEHMRNFDLLLSRIAGWLRTDGKLFVHLFCHRQATYAFQNEGTANWMGRYFFTGGIMPSADLLTRFEGPMRVTKRQQWSGTHYQRTAEAWLMNLDERREQVLDALRARYGINQAQRWLNRWRMFFLAVSELFGYADGNEWHVAHYLMEPTTAGVTCYR